MAVLLFHTSFLLSAHGYTGWPAEVFGWRFGRFGVVLFFVISGALMATLVPRTDVARFLSHRLVRIYPIFWIATVTTTLLQWVQGARVGLDLKALALIPGGAWQYLLGTEWTLPYELVFYLIVSALIAWGAKGWLHLVALAWLVAIAAANAVLPEVQAAWQFPPLLLLPFTEFSAAFACGLAVPWLMQQKRTCAVAPALGGLFILGSEIHPPATLWLLALGSTGIVIGALGAQARTGVMSRCMVVLGDRSFALYLCHVPIILGVLQLVRHEATLLPLWIGTISLCLVAGYLLGSLDIALHRQLRSWIDKRTPILRSSLSAAFVVVFLLASLVVHWQGP
ncbi:acyltransferase family protein [Roseomonas sp. WA12]